MADHAGRAVAAVHGRARADLERDHVLAAALERFIEVVGEAASKVSDSTRSATPEIPWRQIIGMRNRLVRDHASIDPDIVWDAVTLDLPELIEAIKAVPGIE